MIGRSAGLYITELIGTSVNMVTGDYSRALPDSGLKMGNWLSGQRNHDCRKFG
jgi:hypothetical protein